MGDKNESFGVILKSFPNNRRILEKLWLPGETPISGKTWRTLWDITCRKEKKTTTTDNHQQKWLALTFTFQNEIQPTLLRRHKVSCSVLYSLRTSFTTICFRFCLCWAPGRHFMTTTRRETNFSKTGHPTTFKRIDRIVAKWKDTYLKTEGIFVITAHRRRFCWI